MLFEIIYHIDAVYFGSAIRDAGRVLAELVVFADAFDTGVGIKLVDVTVAFVVFGARKKYGIGATIDRGLIVFGLVVLGFYKIRNDKLS